MDWVIEPEFIASIVLLIVFIYSSAGSKQIIENRRTLLFKWCVAVTIAAIAANIFSVYAIEYHEYIPYGLCYELNVIYFLLTPLAVAGICIYVLALIYADSPQRGGFKTAAAIVAAVYFICAALALSNSYTGWLFSFDAQMNYIRGPANRSLYLVLVIYVAVCIAGFWRQRRVADSNIARSMRIVPPVVLITALVQQVFRNTMMTGTAMALALLILYMSFQQKQINIDPLTGLGNRSALIYTLGAYDKSARPYRLILVHLKEFRKINNRCGYQRADLFIRAVGQKLSELSPRAYAYRYSGISFVIMVTADSDAEHESIFAAARALFDSDWDAGGETARLHAVFADVACPKNVATHLDAIAALEYAYARAQGGGNPAVRFDAALQEQFFRRQFLTAYIQKAYDAGNFYLNIQPYYSVSDGAICGGEVLLRLRDEKGRQIPPGEFIPVAEETGLIVQLTWLILEQTCKYIADNKLRLPLSVNVSMQQFLQDDLPDKLQQMTQRFGVSSRYIKLEITERVVLDNIEFVRELMAQLSLKGFGFFLDDFGTGHSNLLSVAQLPLDGIKIDRSLVQSAAGDSEIRKLFASIIEGFRSCRLPVIAEGVESEQELQLVSGMGVETVQGYYFAQPCECDEFAWLLQENRRHLRAAKKPAKQKEAPANSARRRAKE